MAVVGLAKALTKAVNNITRVKTAAYSGTALPSQMCRIKGVSSRMGSDKVKKVLQAFGTVVTVCDIPSEKLSAV